jgi:hypothetical protein
MSQSRMETGNAKHAIHLIDSTADHYFGERQEHKLQFQGWNGELTVASSTIAKRPSGSLVRVGA